MPEVNPIKDKVVNKKSVTSSTSPYYTPSQFKPFNPDSIYRKKGNYDIYDEMREDDAIKSILMTKKYLMLGNGFTIDIEDEEDTQQQEIKEFIEKALTEDIDIDFNKSLLEMLTNMDYGVSFSEIVWKLVNNQYKIRYVKTRAPHSFLIYQDDAGDVTKLEQRSTLHGNIPITNLKNIILFPYQMEFDNWYGKSDLKSAYRAWWSKDFIIKAWNIYLDRFGMPLAIGKFDSTTTTPEDQIKLQQVLDHIQTKTSITIPEDLSIEFLEATRAGEAGYESAINNYNLQIARSMLMPDLMGMAGAKTSGGSFSLGQTQFDMFLKTLEWTRKELERAVQRKIIDPLVRYNFNVEDVPKFKFKAISETVKIESLKTWIELQKSGSYRPSLEELNWARKILGAPESKELEEVEEIGVTKIEAPLTKESNTSKKVIEKDEPDKDEEVAKMASGDTMRKPIMAENKQDFAKVNQDQLNTIEIYSKQASGTIATMLTTLLETVKKGRWIENQKLDKVSALELKYANRLRLDIKTGSKEMFMLGRRDAMVEAKKSQDFALNDEELIYDQVINNAPLLASQGITDDLTKRSQIVLSSGITQGFSSSEVIKQLKEVFEPYLYNIDGAKLDTVMRTNYATAYNQSKLAYLAPAVEDGTIYGYQFSAIMDGRTTDICSSLDGKIFKADNISNIEPPLHMNCRSTLIPILTNEIEEKDIFGASKEENDTFFNDKGKFIESSKDLDGYDMRPGGFYIKKSKQ